MLRQVVLHRNALQVSTRLKLLPILEPMDAQTVALVNGLVLDKRLVALLRNALLVNSRLSLQRLHPLMDVLIAE